MSEFFSLLKVLTICGTVMFVAMMVLMALPQCRLRSVALEVAKWVMAVGLVVLMVSPLDVIPDVVPVLGLGDDIGYFIGAIFAARSAMRERSERKYLE